MNQQSLVLALGAFSFLWFLSRRSDAGPIDVSPTIKKGLTITEAEALGWVQFAKLSYGSLSGLPESVVMATIAVESNFDPNAVAPAGERGLMQIIYPGTWNDILKRAKLPEQLDPWNPKDNILAGMHYLRLVRDELLRAGLITGKDDTDWAIVDQGYNLGPAGVKAGKRNQPRIGKFLLAREKYQRAGLP